MTQRCERRNGFINRTACAEVIRKSPLHLVASTNEIAPLLLSAHSLRYSPVL